MSACGTGGGGSGLLGMRPADTPISEVLPDVQNHIGALWNGGDPPSCRSDPCWQHPQAGSPHGVILGIRYSSVRSQIREGAPMDRVPPRYPPVRPPDTVERGSVGAQVPRSARASCLGRGCRRQAAMRAPAIGMEPTAGMGKPCENMPISSRSRNLPAPVRTFVLDPISVAVCHPTPPNRRRPGSCTSAGSSESGFETCATGGTSPRSPSASGSAQTTRRSPGSRTPLWSQTSTRSCVWPTASASRRPGSSPTTGATATAADAASAGW